MAIFIKSLQNIYASNSKKPFVLSLLGVLAWLLAISLAMMPGHVPMEYGYLVISLLLAISALLSVNAVPRSVQSKNPAPQEMTAKELIHH